MNEEYRCALEGLRAGSAPAYVEQKALRAFRRQKTFRALRLGGLGAVAAGVAVLVWAWQWRPLEIAPPAPLVTHIAAPSLVAVAQRKSVPRPVRPRVRPRQQVAQRAEELATPFYALPGADSLPSPDAEAVVRMAVPRSTLQLVGFPMTEVPRPEFVRADVVFGQDGMARAIRFVQ